jgi:hypothetical protein
MDYNTEWDQEKIDAAIDEMPDDVLQYVAQSFAPWQQPTKIDGELSYANGQSVVDADGFPIPTMTNFIGFDHMQRSCWEKFNKNPQLNSHVRDVMGSLTGYGWDMDSGIEAISDFIYNISYDPRNELYKNIPKYVARAEIEGELFLAATVHEDGFVEIDFMEPSALKGGGDYNSGIYFHPSKPTMPLYYKFSVQNKEGKDIEQIFPSIYLAYYPELAQNIPTKWKITPELLKSARISSRKYKKLGNYRTFIVSWDKGFLTPRNLSHISTTIEWINHYVNLKKWEIDHKKSAGSYLWVASMTDTKAFRTWLKLTPEQKKDTGLTAKKTPGGTLVLPPGVELSCVNPNLPNISEQDTDIMHMITSGLNKPEDMVTGQTKGDTFSGIKASRGPQSDRTQDQIAYFERYLRYDLWRSIITLSNSMNPRIKLEYKIEEAYKFENGEPKFKLRKRPAWELIDIDFPVSEVSDIESKAKALLGVKHASLSEVLGIPRAQIARRLGFHNYRRCRLQYETEDKIYPDLPLTAELDSIQESAIESSIPGDNQNKQKKEKKEEENDI